MLGVGGEGKERRKDCRAVLLFADGPFLVSFPPDVIFQPRGKSSFPINLDSTSEELPPRQDGDPTRQAFPTRGVEEEGSSSTNSPSRWMPPSGSSLVRKMGIPAGNRRRLEECVYRILLGTSQFRSCEGRRGREETKLIVCVEAHLPSFLLPFPASPSSPSLLKMALPSHSTTPSTITPTLPQSVPTSSTPLHPSLPPCRLIASSFSLPSSIGHLRRQQHFGI